MPRKVKMSELEAGAVAVSRDGKARCCFNSKFCNAQSIHYKRPKPAHYKTKHDNRVRLAKPEYKSVAKVLGEKTMAMFARPVGGGAKEDLEQTIQNRKKRNPALMPAHPPEPAPATHPAVNQIQGLLTGLTQAQVQAIMQQLMEEQTGSGRPAKSAQQHAEEAIAQIQAILGALGPMPDVTPKEAMKELSKAKYKQAKYEKEVKADVASLASTGVERVKKQESPWVTHVKTYARHHGVSYKQALTDAKESYHKPKPPVPPAPPVGRRGHLPL